MLKTVILGYEWFAAYINFGESLIIITRKNPGGACPGTYGEKKRTRHGPGAWYALVFLIMALVLPLEAMAEKQIKKDLNQDGKTDQVLTYDNRGTILKVETDEDQDSFFERIQVYEKGKILRMERDMDLDGKLDCFDHFKEEKRVRQERLDPKGKLIQRALFDKDEQIRFMEKNTTEDSKFDSLYYFENGVLVRSTKDTTADGRVNETTWFKNQVPVLQKKDRDGDGVAEDHLFFDEKGNLAKQCRDPFGKGKFGDILLFNRGTPARRIKDTNHDTKPDLVTRFENSLPAAREKDSNLDGKFDIFTRFKKGVVSFREKDNNFDGTPDYFAKFDEKGQPLEIRESKGFSGKIDQIRHFRKGNLYEILKDPDTNKIFDTRSLVEKDQVIKILSDTNQDGTWDQTLFFTPEGERDRMERDTNFNGKTDLWQFYKGSSLVRLEKDENGDGKKDIKIFYAPGAVRQKLIQDTDFNGDFETCQVFNHPKWTRVTTLDLNQDSHPDARTCYTGQIIQKRQVDENLDGRFDLIETYDEKGILETLVEQYPEKGSLTWFYTSAGEAVRAEEDVDGNGKTDVWYFYSSGRLARVEEDTNQDGKPDLWETYDTTETLVKRKKDLDFDGIPDFTDGPSPAAGG
jgi:antitoxin component YwqK of YwqJK toxin-antitoxin module